MNQSARGFFPARDARPHTDGLQRVGELVVAQIDESPPPPIPGYRE